MLHYRIHRTQAQAKIEVVREIWKGIKTNRKRKTIERQIKRNRNKYWGQSNKNRSQTK